MTTNATQPDPPARRGTPTLEELAAAKGITVAPTINSLSHEPLFDSDDEVEEFLAFVTEQRRASLA
jgi:hypothetical protein